MGIDGGNFFNPVVLIANRAGIGRDFLSERLCGWGFGLGFAAIGAESERVFKRAAATCTNGHGYLQSIKDDIVLKMISQNGNCVMGFGVREITGYYPWVRCSKNLHL